MNCQYIVDYFKEYRPGLFFFWPGMTFLCIVRLPSLRSEGVNVSDLPVNP